MDRLKLFRVESMLALVCVLVLMNSCKIEDEPSTVFFYNETRCSDPWEAEKDEESIVVTIRSFLAKSNVLTYDISVLNDGTAESCEACSCMTGRRFKVSISNEDCDKAGDFGFYRE